MLFLDQGLIIAPNSILPFYWGSILGVEHIEELLLCPKHLHLEQSDITKFLLSLLTRGAAMSEGKGFRSLPSPLSARLLPLQLTHNSCRVLTPSSSSAANQTITPAASETREAECHFPIFHVVPSRFTSPTPHNPGWRIKVSFRLTTASGLT